MYERSVRHKIDIRNLMKVSYTTLFIPFLLVRWTSTVRSYFSCTFDKRRVVIRNNETPAWTRENKADTVASTDVVVSVLWVVRTPTRKKKSEKTWLTRKIVWESVNRSSILVSFLDREKVRQCTGHRSSDTPEFHVPRTPLDRSAPE